MIVWDTRNRKGIGCLCWREATGCRKWWGKRSESTYLARTDRRSGLDMNQEGSRYVLKTAGPFCSVLFHKEKRTQGPRNHWVDTTTCLIHFITEKHHLWKEIKCWENYFFFSFFFLNTTWVFVLMIQLVLKHYVDVLLSVANPSENSIWLNCSPFFLLQKKKKKSETALGVSG